MTRSVWLVYPHQLDANHPIFDSSDQAWMIEDPLFFSQYAFHKKKLMLHRASMKHFEQRLLSKDIAVRYVECGEIQTSGDVARLLNEAGVGLIQSVDPNDDWLKRRMQHACDRDGLTIRWIEDKSFLTPGSVQKDWLDGRQRFYFTDFYVQQRKRLGCLMESGKPMGGKWTYDTDNRKRLSPGVAIPEIWKPRENRWVNEARTYVQRQFPNAYGEDADFFYPTNHEDALTWLKTFLRDRLASFGDYEDAMDQHQSHLFHSVLTPMLNTGLLNPSQVVEETLQFLEAYSINNVEGFVRQVIGWREFVRMIYLHAGRVQRTRNYWGFTRPMPSSAYTATTGIEPVDTVICRVMKDAYCHHIERLMILGNFFVLCEIDPDDVYRWFMELFIDAYDWVMVPNVYGMSQYADGGLMTTKPYISGSSYVLKMSNFPKGPWCAIWDGLYWRFIAKHREFFSQNPRMRVMVSQLDKMGSKLSTHERIAEEFLQQLGT